MKIILNLRMFSDDEGHSVTVYADEGFSAIEADETSGVAAETEVTITKTLKTGYEFVGYQVIKGGELEIEEDKFEMPDADVVILATSKADNVYIVTENTYMSVNDAVIRLQKNTRVVMSNSGAIIGVTIDGGGTAVTGFGPAIEGLVKAGVLVKI